MGRAVDFEVTPEFLKSAKILSKRYHSFPEDLKMVKKEISENPNIGDDLGNGVRKIRMAIKSKGKGKRGGARIITFTVEVGEKLSKVTFLYIYDKSDMSNVSDNKIKQIIAANKI